MYSKSFLHLFIYILVCTTSRTIIGDFEDKNNIILLNNGNFDKAITTFSHILIFFYTPWCIHCETLYKELIKAANKFRLQNSHIVIGMLQAGQEPELAAKYDVQSYPALKLFLNGKPINYTGGRTEQDITTWLSKTTPTPCKYIEDLSQFRREAFIHDSIIMFWASTDSIEYRDFEVLSREFGDLLFVYTISPEVQAKYRGDNTRTLFTMIRNFEEPVVHFKEAYSISRLRTFIKENRYPLVMEFHDKYTKRVFGDKNPTIFLVLSREQLQDANLIQEFKQAASRLKGRILFATVAKGTEWGARVIDFLGGEKLKLPLLALVRPLDTSSERYISRGAITTASIIAFYENFIRGSISPSLKTEPLPKSNDDPVTILVGRSYEEAVSQAQKDVFVLLHAPWCKHSKLVYPVWDALAEHLKPIKNLVVAKMDATANEVDGLQITGVPLILFYAANNKTSPITFKGERTLDGLLEWLKYKITVDHDSGLLTKQSPKKEVRPQHKPYGDRKFERLPEVDMERRVPLSTAPFDFPKKSYQGFSPDIPTRLGSQNLPPTGSPAKMNNEL